MEEETIEPDFQAKRESILQSKKELFDLVTHEYTEGDKKVARGALSRICELSLDDGLVLMRRLDIRGKRGWKLLEDSDLRHRHSDVYDHLDDVIRDVGRQVEEDDDEDFLERKGKDLVPVGALHKKFVDFLHQVYEDDMYTDHSLEKEEEFLSPRKKSGVAKADEHYSEFLKDRKFETILSKKDEQFLYLLSRYVVEVSNLYDVDELIKALDRLNLLGPYKTMVGVQLRHSSVRGLITEEGAKDEYNKYYNKKAPFDFNERALRRTRVHPFMGLPGLFRKMLTEQVVERLRKVKEGKVEYDEKSGKYIFQRKKVTSWEQLLSSSLDLLQDKTPLPKEQQRYMEQSYVGRRRRGEFYATALEADFATKAVKEDPTLMLEAILPKRDRSPERTSEQIFLQLFPKEFRTYLAQKRIMAMNAERKKKSSEERLLEYMFGVGASHPSENPLFPTEYTTLDGSDAESFEKQTETVATLSAPTQELLVTGFFGELTEDDATWYKFELPEKGEIFSGEGETEGKEKITVSLASSRKSVLPIPLDWRYGKNVQGQKEEEQLSVRERIRRRKMGQIERPIQNIDTPISPNIPALLPDEVRRLDHPKYDIFKGNETLLDTEISQKKFIERISEFGDELVDPLLETDARFSPEVEIFLKSIKALKPFDRIEAIEDFIRTNSAYDLTNPYAEDKKTSGIQDRLYYIEMHAEDIKIETPKLSHEVFFAGVCADFALLAALMMRRVGIPAGVCTGVKAEALAIKERSSHSVAFALMPDISGKPYPLLVDATAENQYESQKPIRSVKRYRRENVERKREKIIESREKVKSEEATQGPEPKKKKKQITPVDFSLLSLEIPKDEPEKIERLFDALWYTPYQKYLTNPAPADLDERTAFLRHIENELKHGEEEKDFELSLAEVIDASLAKITRSTGDREEAEAIFKRFLSLVKSQISEDAYLASIAGSVLSRGGIAREISEAERV
ncbi:MAG: transglutaminase-like domain-containing protein [Candidatus Pacebacteria bacterium]|nr:transglutaminase-like domain-containing protein [Candidatus Paceibacterota bacterium]